MVKMQKKGPLRFPHKAEQEADTQTRNVAPEWGCRAPEGDGDTQLTTDTGQQTGQQLSGNTAEYQHHSAHYLQALAESTMKPSKERKGMFLKK